MFNSESLFKIFSSTEKTLKSCENDIRNASNDIKLFESKLKEFNIKSFTYLCNHQTEIIPEIDMGDDGMAGKEIHFYEYLSWELNEKEKNQSYRLFYKKTEQDGYIETGGYIGRIEILIARAKIGNEKLIMRRPLIEAPSEIRIKMFSHLPVFLEKLQEQILNDRVDLNSINIKECFDEFENSSKTSKSNSTIDS